MQTAAALLHDVNAKAVLLWWGRDEGTSYNGRYWEGLP